MERGESLVAHPLITLTLTDCPHTWCLCLPLPQQTAKFAQDMKLGALVKGESGEQLFQSFKGADGLVSSKSVLAMVTSSTEQGEIENF